MRDPVSLIRGDDVRGVTHVFVWTPPYLSGGDSNGTWDLQSLADFVVYKPQMDADWCIGLPRNAPPRHLAAWAARRLGTLVTLKRSTRRIRPLGTHRWHREPIYYVTPAGVTR